MLLKMADGCAFVLTQIASDIAGTMISFNMLFQVTGGAKSAATEFADMMKLLRNFASS